MKIEAKASLDDEKGSSTLFYSAATCDKCSWFNSKRRHKGYTKINKKGKYNIDSIRGQ